MLFRAAVIRLLVCGTNYNDDYLWPYLSPHVACFPLTSDELHINDRAALTVILHASGQTSQELQVWENVYAVVSNTHGERHIRTTRAALRLARTYALNGDWKRTEQMERDEVMTMTETVGRSHADAERVLSEVLDGNRNILGIQHDVTLKTLHWLGWSIYSQKRFVEAELLWREVATGWRASAESHEDEISDTLYALGRSLYDQQRFADAEVLWREVLTKDGWQGTLSDDQWYLWYSIYWLGMSLYNQRRFAEAEYVLKDASAWSQRMRGNSDYETLSVSYWLCLSIHSQHRLDDAQTLFREITMGEGTTAADRDTILSALFWHGQPRYDDTRFEIAEEMLKAVTDSWRDPAGPQHADTLKAMFCLDGSLYNQCKSAECEVALRQLIDGWQATLGEQHVVTLEAQRWLFLTKFSMTDEIRRLHAGGPSTSQSELPARPTSVATSRNQIT